MNRKFYNLYSAAIVYTIEYKTGFLNKKTVTQEITRDISNIYYDILPTRVIEKVKELNVYKRDFISWLDLDVPYKIINKSVEPYCIENASIDYLKKNMSSKEFIEYVYDMWNSVGSKLIIE
jgi:hypothetical protein